MLSPFNIIKGVLGRDIWNTEMWKTQSGSALQKLEYAVGTPEYGRICVEYVLNMEVLTALAGYMVWATSGQRKWATCPRHAGGPDCMRWGKVFLPLADV